MGLSLIALCAVGQIPPCKNLKFTFEVNHNSVQDTLGDMQIRLNHQLYLNMHNIVRLSEKITVPNQLLIEGANACLYNDTTLIVVPSAPEIKFHYNTAYSCHEIVQRVRTREKEDFRIFLDKRQLAEGEVIRKFNEIDTLSFQLITDNSHFGIAQENLKYTISYFRITLVRNDRPVAQKRLGQGTSYYIGDILHKAISGDRITVEFAPMFIKQDGSLERNGCPRLLFHHLEAE